ncbi:trp operon leader peptide [Streptomyces sp. NPDC091292]
MSVGRAGRRVVGRRTSGRVRDMFAHSLPSSVQNWWWTAHPAAH